MRADKQVNKINRSFLKYLREMDEIKNEMEYVDKCRAECKREIAKNMLSEGIEPKLIQKTTGLALETIQELQCFTA